MSDFTKSISGSFVRWYLICYQNKLSLQLNDIVCSFLPEFKIINWSPNVSVAHRWSYTALCLKFLVPRNQFSMVEITLFAILTNSATRVCLSGFPKVCQAEHCGNRVVVTISKVRFTNKRVKKGSFCEIAISTLVYFFLVSNGMNMDLHIQISFAYC